jgi:hypothetical protein
MADALGEARRLTAAIDALTKKIDEAPTRANTANVSVNAGGIGVWVASTCAAVAMTMCLAMGGVILNQQREIGELRQYLAAIYMQVPHLKPEGSE